LILDLENSSKNYLLVPLMFDNGSYMLNTQAILDMSNMKDSKFEDEHDLLISKFDCRKVYKVQTKIP
jgi:hypothetical protein